MKILEILLLAALQGLTEFLPISSSGHLVLARSLLDSPAAGSLGVVIILHLGTAAAAMFYYRGELGDILRAAKPPFRGGSRAVSRPRRILLLLVVASLPTAVIGLTFEDFFEGLFHSPDSIAPSLFVTGAVLFAASRLRDGGEHLEEMAWWKAALIGVAQGLAIVPGISRSGMTIAAGLLFGLRRVEAVEFSFLMLLPALLGAAALRSSGLASLGTEHLLQSIVGFITSALVGYASIRLVVRWTGMGRLWYFGVYCWGVATLTLLLSRLG